MAYEFIAQGVQPPQVADPTTFAMHGMQLRDLIQRGQMQDLQIQQARMDLADQQNMRTKLPQMLNDPSYQTNGAPDWDKVVRGLAPYVSPKTVIGLQTTILGNAEKRAQTNKAISDAAEADQRTADLKRKAAEAERDYLGTIAVQLQDADYNPAVFDANLLHAETTNPQWKDHIEAIRQQVAADPNKAKQIIDTLAAASPNAQKAYADNRKSAADLAEKEAQTGKLTSEMNALDALSSPKKVSEMVDDAIDPTKYPDINKRTKAQVHFAASNRNMAGVNEAMNAGADAVKQIEYATNPNVIKAEVGKSVATASATAPIHAAATIAAQRGQYAGTPMANVPPHLVTAASNDYAKVGKEYAGAVNAAAEMQDIINAARSGNKVAYAYAPTTGVLTINTANGVKRVNMAEIGSYGAAGSAFDRLKGWLGKQATGASIPADVLNDMESLHSTLADNARKTYENNIAVINQTYGSQFQPAQLPNAAPSAQQQPVPSNVADALKNYGPGIHTLNDGSRWMKDPSGKITKQ